MSLGDLAIGTTVDVKFTTAVNGVPTTLAGTPVVSAYVGNGTTEITAGITLTVDFDGVTGLHNVRVVASVGNGFAATTNVQLVITTGTVGGASVVGTVIEDFSLANRVVASVVGAVGSVTAVSAGAIVNTSFGAGAIDNAAIAADAIGSSELASSAVDEIWAKACTEPSAVVAASPAAIAALSWLLTLSRNTITQTATLQSLKADDTTTLIASAALTDDGVTLTKAEFT